MKIFDSLEILKGKIAKNRVVMPPMCTTMSDKGIPNEFHIQHYGSRAYGGVGTIIIEATAIMENGKIKPKDLGLWNKEQAREFKKITSIAKKAGSIIGVQLNHAGNKAETPKGMTKYGTTKKYYDYLDQSKLIIATPKILKEIRDGFLNSAKLAKEAGFDFIELHAAHGYFLSAMISRHLNEVTPNKDIVVRSKILLDILKDITTKVKIRVGIRLSLGDHAKDGMELKEYKPLIKAIEKYVDYIHVSSGETIARVRMADVITNGDKLFRIPIAKEVKKWTDKNVIVVGNFSTREDVDRALKAKIDAVAIGRELIYDPNLVITTLLKADEIDKDKHHWNNNPWFHPKIHKEFKGK